MAVFFFLLFKFPLENEIQMFYCHNLNNVKAAFSYKLTFSELVLHTLKCNS